MIQFDKFLSHIFFINVNIRECNFAMGTILGKGFAQALVHTSQHLCLRYSCCDLYALVLVQNPFPRFPMAKLDVSILAGNLNSGLSYLITAVRMHSRAVARSENLGGAI